jgi:hypothetical protein
MNLSRRQALSVLGGGVATAAAAALVVRASPLGVRDAGRAVRGMLPAPALPPAAVGPLADASRAVLLALPAALVDSDVALAHYAAFYAFRAETLPGYRALYASFARDVDREAGAAGFAAASRPDRRRALRDLGLRPSPPGPVRVITGRQLARYDQFIIRETLRLFNATDAWVLAGYGVWPGQPRQLNHYLQELPSGSSTAAG